MATFVQTSTTSSSITSTITSTLLLPTFILLLYYFIRRYEILELKRLADLDQRIEQARREEQEIYSRVQLFRARMNWMIEYQAEFATLDWRDYVKSWKVDVLAPVA
ncbi:4669_t:CDS:1 [Ambispora gerdemannii]|uniref:4669_t:CDS:1 n=1 Tax=Ambispora gerdemannii TaxID=144530 RepID=A0A9N9CZZ4_9GLOM|nr:4669_t:CDS:1 [Ambispora gerdemannii]